MPLFPLWDTKIKHNIHIRSSCWCDTEHVFWIFSQRPFKKICPSRCDCPSESEIFIASFSQPSTTVLAGMIIFPDNFQTCLACQSLGAPSACALLWLVPLQVTWLYILFPPSLGSKVIKCFWNNYSTAIFQTFFKGLYHHDNLIIQWLLKGAFGLVTRKLIWGFCSWDWWLECLKSVLSSEMPLTVPQGPAGWGPAGWWMRMKTADLARGGLHSNSSHKKHVWRTYCVKFLTLNYEQTHRSP